MKASLGPPLGGNHRTRSSDVRHMGPIRSGTSGKTFRMVRLVPVEVHLGSELK